MSVLPMGLNIFKGVKAYRTSRSGADDWSDPNRQVFTATDPADSDTWILNFSAGSITRDLARQQGIVVALADATKMYFCGNGNVRKEIIVAISDPYFMLNSEWGRPWTISVGAFFRSGYYFLFCLVIHQASLDYRMMCIASNDYGTSWVEFDFANSPHINRTAGFISLVWDGVSDTVYLLATPDRFDYFLYTFNIKTKTWGVASPALNVVNGFRHDVLQSGFIATFSDGSIGVINTLGGTLGIVYHVLIAGVWSAQFNIKAAGYKFEAAIQDGDTIHCFGYPTGQNEDGTGIYFTLQKDGTVSADLFTFPTGDSDGFGRGIVSSNTILIPKDFHADTANAVWSCTVGDTTFVKELLPGPIVPDGTPVSCTEVYYVDSKLLIEPTAMITQPKQVPLPDPQVMCCFGQQKACIKKPLRAKHQMIASKTIFYAVN